MATGSSNEDQFDRKITYCDRDFQDYSLRHEIYLAPVDLEEETRLRDQHEMLKWIYRDWHNLLHPDFIGEPESVLDCAFGTGNWAYDLAEYDPDCSVTGVDISPLMAPPDQLENMDLQVLRPIIIYIRCGGDLTAPVGPPQGLVLFRRFPQASLLKIQPTEDGIANLNDRLDFAESESFDLIHSRFVADGIASSRWPNYFRDIYRLLKRNGWVQVTEWDFTFRSATGNSDALQALRVWSQLHAQSLGASSRPQGRKRGRVTEDCEAWMRMAGFVDVSADVRDIPTCPWPTDSHGRSIGQANLSNMKETLHALALYPVTHRQFRTIDEFNELVDAASSELGNIQAKPYLRLHTFFGRKP
ncbi:S-adenosyl-L-methionine-dependent methyltransferase [Exophiala viscosa]|uniref:S-adenosyl-L-methionine-dependent methyltransferase n=1 Tax=Exophiala viscosa TaxID=2486360 RepID=UPI002195E3F6|nr:S-adenosyl-L-methionine-dependent methyltransferase [Exophiala viscosa]